MLFFSLQKEVGNLQIEVNGLKYKLSNQEKLLENLSKEIMNLEKKLYSNLLTISKFKAEQKKIMDCLNEDSFKVFNQNFNKIPNEHQEIILLFFRYENKYKEELNFILNKWENLQSLLKNSYSFFKTLEEIDKDNYNNYEKRFIDLKKKNNQNSQMKPFKQIFDFINNTLQIIDLNKMNKKLNVQIEEKNKNKNNKFMENKILEESIKEKQEKLKNISIYIKHLNNILIKYKNFFGNSLSSKNNTNFKNNYYIKKNNTNNNEYIDTTMIKNYADKAGKPKKNNFYLSIKKVNGKSSPKTKETEQHYINKNKKKLSSLSSSIPEFKLMKKKINLEQRRYEQNLSQSFPDLYIKSLNIFKSNQNNVVKTTTSDKSNFKNISLCETEKKRKLMNEFNFSNDKNNSFNIPYYNFDEIVNNHIKKRNVKNIKVRNQFIDYEFIKEIMLTDKKPKEDEIPIEDKKIYIKEFKKVIKTELNSKDQFNNQAKIGHSQTGVYNYTRKISKPSSSRIKK